MILITGATGLVGSHLALHLLENGQNVRAIYRNLNHISKTKKVFEHRKNLHLFEKIEWVEANILDICSLEKAFLNIRIVYHCAAMISFDPKNEEAMRKTNIEGTANIVNFCLSNNIQKLCYVSSIATLGDLSENQKTINEETDWNPEKPHSDYAISKYGAEIEIWRGAQEGLTCIVVNPGIVLGPFFWNSGSGLLFKKAYKLKFFTKGSTGFVSVYDVVKIMNLLMNSDISNQRFIVIAENCSFKKIIFAIAEALKVQKPIFYAKPWITNIAWRIDWVLTNLFFQNRKLSKAMANVLHSKDFISNEKIQKTIDFQFENIFETIDRIAKIYRA